MALPTDSSDTFIREVEENYRRDQVRDFFKRYGTWLAVALVLFLAAVGGYLYWQERQRGEAAEDSEELAAIYRDIGAGRLQAVPQRLDALAGEGGDVARASALFTAAAVALERNDRNTALTKYRQVQNDGDLPQAYRDLALIRATTIEFDQLKPEEVVARVQPLAKSGEPWFGSAGELTAIALIKQGKRAEAARIFAAIAADRGVPETLRARAVQIAGMLGLDASANMPTISQPFGTQ